MNADVIVHKANEAFVRIECESGIGWEIRSYFEFMVPGHQFMPKFKAGIWDGKIRLFNIRNNTLYKGLTHQLEKFCQERGYHLTYSFEEYDNEISLFEAEKFIDSLEHTLENRDYQISALAKTIRKKRIILLSPTASGKSKIIYDFLRWVLDKKSKGLLIVPTVQLVEQLYKDFQDYSKKNGWNVEENVHMVYEGKQKATDKRLTISTWQSMYTMDPSWFKQYDFVIGDEVHTFKSKSLTYIMENLVNAEYRVGLSGTLDGTNTHRMVLEGLFGQVFQVATTKQLMDQKYLSNLMIKTLVLKHPADICKIAQKWKYQDEVEYLVKSDARNKFIKNLALSLEGNTLVLFNFVDKHGKILYEKIKSDIPADKKVHFISGDVDVKVRENIRDTISKSTGNIIVASYGTTSTGINMPNLHNTIFASAYKARIKNLQSIGRGLRIGSDGNDMHTLYDIADDLRYTKKENATLKHFVVRLQLYVSEKFDFKTYKITLKGS